MQSSKKLIVRLKAGSRDLGCAGKSEIKLEDKDSAKIIIADPNGKKDWDKTYALIEPNGDYSFAEPDVEVSKVFYEHGEEILERGESTAASYYKFIDYWPHPEEPSIWHLDDTHSQLKNARDNIAGMQVNKKVRIAHIDTGCYKAHVSYPASLIRTDLQKNFVDGENEADAADSFASGTLKMPGHGTVTLSILAGAKIKIDPCNFDDTIGLSGNIEIIPIRIAKSVVLIKSHAFAKALDYIINELNIDESKRIHIVTMSMGGVASAVWADLINIAYEKGIFIVTAAGNNYKKLPARTMIFPARFGRVVAACGATYDLSPYSKPRGEGSIHILEGNFGPDALMDTAIAAFTPNVPWATYKFATVVGIRGDGTSSATPQVASAAALYYLKNYDALEALPEPWMRVEAIRKALFDSAKKEINTNNGDYDDDYKKYYGNGILQAMKMLNEKVASPGELQKQKEDKVSFPFFKVILGIRAIDEKEMIQEEMMETELMQLVLTDPGLQEILHDEEQSLDNLSKTQQKEIAEAVIQNDAASDFLKERMTLVLNQLNLK